MKKPLLVLDWDETLVTTQAAVLFNAPRSTEPSVLLPIDRNGLFAPVRVFLRPHVKTFLHTISKRYHVYLWSYGVRDYIVRGLNLTGLSVFFEDRVLTRENMPLPLKDLWQITQGARLNETVIVDDNPTQTGALNPYNCIPIPAYQRPSASDRVLLRMPEKIDQHFETVLAQRSNEELNALRTRILTNYNTPTFT